MGVGVYLDRYTNMFEKKKQHINRSLTVKLNA